MKTTIRTYYGDPGRHRGQDDVAVHLRDARHPRSDAEGLPQGGLDDAAGHGKKPAIVLDADDTTLWTYDMEDAEMNFIFDPARQDVWVQEQLFPATPGMVELRQQGRRRWASPSSG